VRVADLLLFLVKVCGVLLKMLLIFKHLGWFCVSPTAKITRVVYEMI
jgi:hypothetical protein